MPRATLCTGAMCLVPGVTMMLEPHSCCPWCRLAKTPGGPSAKFQMSNIHTMDELNLTGNCLMVTYEGCRFQRVAVPMALVWSGRPIMLALRLDLLSQGSRPLLSFDAGFDEEPHLQVVQVGTYCTHDLAEMGCWGWYGNDESMMCSHALCFRSPEHCRHALCFRSPEHMP